MEELLFFALLGTQIVLILIVITLRCRNALVEIRDAIKPAHINLEDSEGRIVNVVTELRSIHKQLRNIECHTRKPAAAIED